jgi:hypothetical protein
MPHALPHMSQAPHHPHGGKTPANCLVVTHPLVSRDICRPGPSFHLPGMWHLMSLMPWLMSYGTADISGVHGARAHCPHLQTPTLLGGSQHPASTLLAVCA